jgi:hypothetical protein
VDEFLQILNRVELVELELGSQLRMMRLLLSAHFAPEKIVCREPGGLKKPDRERLVLTELGRLSRQNNKDKCLRQVRRRVQAQSDQGAREQSLGGGQGP